MMMTLMSLTNLYHPDPLSWPGDCDNDHHWYFITIIREGCGKSKWKFKMAFAIRRPKLSAKHVFTVRE